MLVEAQDLFLPGRQPRSPLGLHSLWLRLSPRELAPRPRRPPRQRCSCFPSVLRILHGPCCHGFMHLWWQSLWKILALQPHLDQVHGEGVFVEREGPVLVHVGQRPDLVQDAGRQHALYQLRLGLLSRYPALLVRPQGLKVTSVLVDVGRAQPLGLPRGVLRRAPGLHHCKRRSRSADLLQVQQVLATRLVRHHLEQPWNVVAQHGLQSVHLLLVQLGELVKVRARDGELFLHHPGVREVAESQALLLGDVLVNAREVCYQLLLLLALPHERRHLSFEVVHEEGVNLRKPRPLDEVVQLPHGGASRQLRQLRVEVVLLRLEELPLLVVVQGLLPEGAEVDAGDLRCVDDFAEVPHEGAVHAHQLRGRAAVGLVEDDVDLVVVPLAGVDHAPELVGDVQLGHVEEDQNHVHAIREPLHNRLVLVAALEPLLFARQNPRSVDQRDSLEHRVFELRALEAAEEVVAKVRQLRERHRLVYDERVARDDLVGLAVTDSHELVRGGLRADPEAGVVPAEQVSDEGALARRVLAY
mmetsp:Transcript_42424/g.112291  ORF Transcript_42424/g.112291 Transcript_42424/m.112291 type:complete len:528 (+) Transcript_42424:107-1690(+)